ncbi:metallophosphoesterase domain-containing protein 1-like isoform X2 [Physella acuta]|uniref:metallophosphoesterase domain-containing protein 1-like isoform X2 n=1 Tax=Physella acuta TaxID=109671 RepID=UPI0027DB7914|nr:metallophosphoesterase domain-containing protein 1-like isoform X2 [Physella acuta]
MDRLRALANFVDSKNVSVHRLTEDPTKAWDTMKAKQVVQVLEPLDPLTSLSEDKIRFVFLSDTHNKIERLDSFVPAGDVLLHAGDFTSIGLPKSIHEFNQYLGNLPHKVKIIIAGNHEITLDSTMINREDIKDYVSKKFNILPASYDEVLVKLNVTSSRDLLTNCIYLMDSSIDVCGIKIYGSPWQPEFHGWAFNLPRGAQCLEKWNMIPDDTDILMTHGPPLGCYLARWRLLVLRSQGSYSAPMRQCNLGVGALRAPLYVPDTWVVIEVCSTI